MSDLKWRAVSELRLAARLVPNPNSSSELLDRLNHVRVAIEGNLLHIDPRQRTGQEVDKSEEYDVTVVPTSAVEYIRYRVTPASPRVTVVR
ncbi:MULTISPECIES: hypothetical protein [Kitasatospora]|uniref:Uncharacterized protein n=2 Tax=Kitasatospora TaxID=2063 RepID=A0ABT1J0H3_9ACTN|nr:hypothetical protein [Kitasatospora paracochleata]MCP2310902.1 hypothetical protein [Kitasatospora paracochleata]